MGKIYKNLTPIPPKPNFTPSTDKLYTIPFALEETKKNFTIPQGKVIPLDQFSIIFKKAVEELENNNIESALQHLVNLEVTDFNNLEVHEMLADLFLRINEIGLAKEQCQICARLMEKQNPLSPNLLNLKTFDQLVQEAGDPEEVQKEFDNVMKSEVDNNSFYHGTKTAMNLATLKISEKKYQEAEQLLTAYRNRCLKFMQQQEHSL
ncbi:MAG: tetratricopeptide repeat protein [Brevinemataceae bacterium]